MASWKKVIVSGSNISQLVNDAGYIASVGGGILSSSAEGDAQGQIKLNGVAVDANALGTGDSPTFVTVTAALNGNAGTATKLATARAITTTGDVVITSTTFDGSADFSAAATIQDGAVENSMFADNAKTAISGAFTSTSASIAADIALLEAAEYDLNIAADSGTGIITNAETLIVQGGAGGGITVDMSTNTLTITATGGIVSASSFSSPSQGTVRATINGVNTDVDTGLQVGDSPQFTNLTVTGDLIVEGSRTELQVTNLNVEDQFILINSGSAGADTGIIFGGSDSAAGNGYAIYWDNTDSVFGFSDDVVAHNASSAAVGTKLGAIQTSTNEPGGAPFQGVGSINVSNNEDIWIYS